MVCSRLVSGFIRGLYLFPLLRNVKTWRLNPFALVEIEIFWWLFALGTTDFYWFSPKIFLALTRTLLLACLGTTDARFPVMCCFSIDWPPKQLNAANAFKIHCCQATGPSLGVLILRATCVWKFCSHFWSDTRILLLIVTFCIFLSSIAVQSALHNTAELTLRSRGELWSLSCELLELYELHVK